MADLPPDKLKEALSVIAGWRLAPDDPARCPVCGSEGLTIIDRSARPYTEWYALQCEACGLSASLSVPMAGPYGG